MWEETLHDMQDQLEVTWHLRVPRNRAPEELPQRVSELQVLMIEAPGDRALMRVLRASARRARSRNPTGFDALWKEAASDLPSWLTIDPALENELVALWNTTSWAWSRD